MAAISNLWRSLAKTIAEENQNMYAIRFKYRQFMQCNPYEFCNPKEMTNQTFALIPSRQMIELDVQVLFCLFIAEYLENE